MSATIQLRRATAAAWTAADPTLAEGEFGFETNTLKMKIGDGVTQWTLLAYWSTGGGGITGSGTAGTLSVFTAATAIGDSGMLQIPNPNTPGEKALGINIDAATLSNVGLQGGALVAGQTYGDPQSNYPAIIAWSKDNYESMIGTGTGYEFWGTYYDAVTPAPFRLAGIYAESENDATSTQSTHNSTLRFQTVKSHAAINRLTIDSTSRFRLYNQNAITANEDTAFGFLNGQYGQLTPASPTTGGLIITGAKRSTSPTSGISLYSYLGAEATAGAVAVNCAMWNGATGLKNFAAATRLFQISNNGAVGVAVFGNGDLSTIGWLGAMPSALTPPAYPLHISKFGTVNINTDFAALENLYYDCAMLGTETGLVFRQGFYNGGAPSVVDAARISFVVDDTWASTSTQNGGLNFYTISHGVCEKKLQINALGALYGYCPVAVQALTANEQTAFGCGPLDEYHLSPTTQQGGLLSSVFVAAASAHNWGFAWSSLLGDEPAIASHLFDTSKHDGSGGLEAVAAGSLLMVVRNASVSKFSVAGNGDIAWSGTATGVIDGGGA